MWKTGRLAEWRASLNLVTLKVRWKQRALFWRGPAWALGLRAAWLWAERAETVLDPEAPETQGLEGALET